MQNSNKINSISNRTKRVANIKNEVLMKIDEERFSKPDSIIVNWLSPIVLLLENLTWMKNKRIIIIKLEIPKTKMIWRI